MEERTLLNKLERFGAKSTQLPLDELKKTLNTLEASIGPIPESYRAYLLHFGASVLFDVNVVFKALQPSPWSDEQGTIRLSLYTVLQNRVKNILSLKWLIHTGMIFAINGYR
jgi:hypothetical protein